MGALVNITCTPGANFAWQNATHGEVAVWRRLARDPIFAPRWHRVKRHPNGCWFLQMAPGNPAGHVYLTAGRGRRVTAHRHAYRIVKGPIPVGAVVRHQCDDPACINPAHLVVGSQRENIHDSIDRGRRNAFGRQRLQQTDADAIRVRYAAGESQKAIAVSYGVSKGCIHAVVHLKTHMRTVPRQTNADKTQSLTGEAAFQRSAR